MLTSETLSSVPFALTCIALFLVVVLLIMNTTIGSCTRPSLTLPPGPSGLPLIGCLLKVGGYPFKKFEEWSKTYGPIIHVKMGGQNWVVLNDFESLKQVVLGDFILHRSMVKYLTPMKLRRGKTMIIP